MFILDEISCAIENAALLVEEKAYTLTHPFLWDSGTSSSSEEDEIMGVEEDEEEDDALEEFYRRSLEIARDSLSWGRGPDTVSEPVVKKTPKSFEGEDKLPEINQKG